ncbi:hypothetical protein B0T19DRAFT_129391 [Cercophora scortea]|uniref:Uncharacterized protein n=1 Tax=Cercophora scortea TaxID=314031 RepID=A0AAE0IYD6_9PEZI|nr:hypothetical protein B0T19DRAFT_129391 [Cercophora scortea]
MKLTTSFLAVTTAVASVVAAGGISSLARASKNERRELGGVLICNGANAQGRCQYNTYKLDTCYNLTAPYYRNASTFAPDGDGFYCYPYIMPCGGICMSPEGCTLGPVSFSYPYKFNLSAVGWDHYISSFDCHLS